MKLTPGVGILNNVSKKFLKGHMNKSLQNQNRTTFNHLNIKLVRYSDPHCILKV